MLGLITKAQTAFHGLKRKFADDESGATAIEYGLIAALVSVAGIAALNAMGDSLEEMFETVSEELNNAVA